MTIKGENSMVGCDEITQWKEALLRADSHDYCGRGHVVYMIDNRIAQLNNGSDNQIFSINEIEAVLIEIAKDISGDCGLTEPDVDYIIDELKRKKTC